MLHSSRALLALVILSMAAPACALPAIGLQDPAAISTAAAQTVIAGFTQAAFLTAPSATPSETPSPTLTATLEPPTLTSTPEPPTLTPTETLTATPVFTPTPVFPVISVSVPTNCRSGPGKVYPMEGALLVGEFAQVYGREPTGNYWYIRNPDSDSEFCWLWGQYATVTGNTDFLPLYTPPPSPVPTFTPTPAPDFEASYTGLETCVGWWAEIKLSNTGSIPFKSMGITVKDTVNDTVLANFTDVFTDLKGCLSTTTRDTLGVDNAFVVSSPAFSQNPSGHKIRATITLCSNAGQNGTCVTRTINFTP